jgi:hypothetical protein
MSKSAAENTSFFNTTNLPCFKRNEPAFDLWTHLYRITGVDLTQVPG